MAFVSAKERARSHIIRKLMSRHFKPNSRISELGLSKELGISRAPVREALREIASRGMLEIVAGFGAYIRVPGRRELGDIFACREALEAKAAQLAAANVDPAKLATLRHSLEMLRATLERVREQGLVELDEVSGVALLKADLQLHRTILQAAKNPQLARLLAEMHLMQRTWTQRLDNHRFSLAKALQITLKEHAAIVDAIARRNGHRAAKAMRRHVRASARRFLRQHDETVLQEHHHPPAVVRMLLELDLDGQ